MLDLIKGNWKKAPSPAKNEIQCPLDLRANLHMLERLSQENVLQAEEHLNICTVVRPVVVVTPETNGGHQR